MSDHRDVQECESFQEDLAELALGILPGRARADILAHVEECQWCSADLMDLTEVSDSLLLLAPEMEPPLGFELRLADRIKSSVPARRTGLPRRMLVIGIAAVFFVILGIGLGLVTNSQSPSAPPWSTSAALTAVTTSSHPQVLGRVTVSAGKPGWIVMMVDDNAWSGEVTCEVMLGGKNIKRVGKFKLSNGYGTWAVPLTSSAHTVYGARLVSGNGAVIASAHFST
jgi:hypothetical protein